MILSLDTFLGAFGFSLMVCGWLGLRDLVQVAETLPFVEPSSDAGAHSLSQLSSALALFDRFGCFSICIEHIKMMIFGTCAPSA